VASDEWRDGSDSETQFVASREALGDPETRNRKPALREIVMREKWRRGSRNVDRKEDGLGEFYD
jgi:hypothetical protein